MKFITLTDANQETRKYTINVNNITCIETYVNYEGKLFTWVYVHGFEDGQVCVKETGEQILDALQRQQTIDKLLKSVVR